MAGNSQMYFFMGAMPLALLFICYILEHNELDKMFFLKKSGFLPILRVSALVLVLLGVAFFINLQAGNIRIGLQNFKVSSFIGPSQVHNIDSPNQTVKNDDFEALDWVRKNTDLDVVLLADRDVIEGSRFLYGSFSERQMYFEPLYAWLPEGEVNTREQLIKDIYNINSAQAIIKAKELGVDYILQTKWLTPQFEIPKSLGELAYETETIAVYRLK